MGPTPASAQSSWSALLYFHSPGQLLMEGRAFGLLPLAIPECRNQCKQPPCAPTRLLACSKPTNHTSRPAFGSNPCRATHQCFRAIKVAEPSLCTWVSASPVAGQCHCTEVAMSSPPTSTVGVPAGVTRRKTTSHDLKQSAPIDVAATTKLGPRRSLDYRAGFTLSRFYTTF